MQTVSVTWVSVAVMLVVPRTALGHTVVIDAPNPSCGVSRVRCEADIAGEPSRVSDQVAAVARDVSGLRDCLDAVGFRSTPAAATVSWSVDAERTERGKPSVTIERGESEYQRACAALAEARLDEVASAVSFSVRCAYECEARVAAESPTPAASPIADTPPTASATSSMSADAGARSSSRWYGWQTLTADAISAGILTIGLTSWTVESTVAGHAGILFATPVVHAVHGNVGRGFGSFALRLLVPSLGAGLGLGAAYLSEKDGITELSAVRAAGIGAGIGAAMCIALDATVLAYDRPHDAGREPRNAIMLHVDRTIGVAGTF